MQKKLTMLGILVVFALAIVACGGPAGGVALPQAKAGTSLRKIQDRGRLIAGNVIDQPTFSYMNPQTKQMEGFATAVAREIAAYIFGDPNKIEFKEATLANRMSLVKDGTIDILTASIITEDRLKDADFSVVFLKAGGRFLVRSDSPVKGLGDLDGKKIGMPQGSLYATVLPKLTKAQMVEVANLNVASQALVDKQVDAVASIDTNLYGMALLNPSLKVVGAAYTIEPLGVGVAKGNPELLDAVNAAIANLKSSGKWKAIWQKEIGDKFGMTTAPEPPGDDWRKP